MTKLKFITSNLGIIDHGKGEYEIVEHKAFADSEEEAQEKVDELYEEE
jgi:hypothetical protein